MIKLIISIFVLILIWILFLAFAMQKNVLLECPDCIDMSWYDYTMSLWNLHFGDIFYTHWYSILVAFSLTLNLLFLGLFTSLKDMLFNGLLRVGKGEGE